MLNRKKTLIAMTLLAMVTASGIAIAQEEGRSWWRGWGMGRMMDGPMMGRGYMGGMGPMGGYDTDGMLDRIDGRLAFMKTELKIRDDQTAQWDELARVIRDNAETHNDMMRSMMEEMQDGEYFDKPLPDRLTEMETHMEARLEQIRSIREAVDAFYKVLDDDQKKAADDVVLPVMGMGMGRMMGSGMFAR